MKVLISAYACDPEAGSEPHNGWFTAEAVASEGHEVTLLTTVAGRESILAYVARNPELASINIVFLVNYGIGVGYHPIIGGYADYIQWQIKVSHWIAETTIPWDVAHHVTYGSITLPCGLWNIKAPLVIGPVGGGQIMKRDHYTWAVGSHSRERIRSTIVRLMKFNPVARRNVAKASLILTVNSETERRIRSMGQTKTIMALAESIPENQIDRAPGGLSTRGMHIICLLYTSPSPRD